MYSCSHGAARTISGRDLLRDIEVFRASSLTVEMLQQPLSTFWTERNRNDDELGSRIPALVKAVWSVLVVPHSNSAVEGSFAIMNGCMDRGRYWTAPDLLEARVVLKTWLRDKGGDITVANEMAIIEPPLAMVEVVADRLRRRFASATEQARYAGRVSQQIRRERQQRQQTQDNQGEEPTTAETAADRVAEGSRNSFDAIVSMELDRTDELAAAATDLDLTLGDSTERITADTCCDADFLLDERA